MMAGIRNQDSRAIGTVAATASVAALACGVCCVLPFALPAAMLGMFGGVIVWFSGAYRWLTPLSIVAVVVGWMWVAIQSKRSEKRPAGSTLVIMGIATVMMALALLWPTVEGPIARMLSQTR